MTALSGADCDAIIAEASDGLMPATVRDRAVDRAVRDAELWRPGPTSETWRILEPFGFAEVQVVRYGVGGHYVWHRDSGPGHEGRRWTVVVQLSDPGSYRGGGLETRPVRGGAVRVWPRGRGSVARFPSSTRHRVVPVTSGVRWSVVGWTER